MSQEANTTFLEVVVPTADYQDLQRPALQPAQRPASIRGKTIALLPNLKAFSPPFMTALVQRFSRETGVKHSFMHSPDWQFAHPQRAAAIGPEVDKLARECDLMISGVGD